MHRETKLVVTAGVHEADQGGAHEPRVVHYIEHVQYLEASLAKGKERAAAIHGTSFHLAARARKRTVKSKEI